MWKSNRNEESFLQHLYFSFCKEYWSPMLLKLCCICTWHDTGIFIYMTWECIEPNATQTSYKIYKALITSCEVFTPMSEIKRWIKEVYLLNCIFKGERNVVYCLASRPIPSIWLQNTFVIRYECEVIVLYFDEWTSMVEMRDIKQEPTVEL